MNRLLKELVGYGAALTASSRVAGSLDAAWGAVMMVFGAALIALSWHGRRRAHARSGNAGFDA